MWRLPSHKQLLGEWLLPGNGGTIVLMKQQAPRVVVPPHPGPMRMNRSDPGVHGFLIMIAFAVLGIVGLPLYRLFLVGAVGFGLVVACLLYFIRKTKKKPSGLFPLDEVMVKHSTSERVDSRDRLPDNQRMHVVGSLVSLH